MKNGFTGLNTYGMHEGPVSGDVKAVEISLASAVTLTEDQRACALIEVTVGHATNICVLGCNSPHIFVVVNKGSLAAGFKNTSEDTAVSVAAGKAAILAVDSTGELVRVTADA